MYFFVYDRSYIHTYTDDSDDSVLDIILVVKKMKNPPKVHIKLEVLLNQFFEFLSNLD